MSGFIRFLGSTFIFFWIATLFFGTDLKGFFPDEYKIYSEEILNHKWLLLILGIVLSIIGSLTKVKDVLKKKNVNNNRSSSYKESSQNWSSYKSSKIETNTIHLKQNFIPEQQDHIRKEFANKQTGHLKELAVNTDWTPLSSGGANFKTSLLKSINSSRLEVHKSKGGFLFSAIFSIVGFGVMILGSYFIIVDHGFSYAILGPIVFGGLFAVVGVAFLIYPRPRVFDRRFGWFWSGDKTLAREQDFMRLKQSARLSDIAAIQVIAEHLSKRKGSSYTSWEINLVSKDGKRLNVMDHGNKNSISVDAKKLGEFLDVPVWENI